MKVTILTPDFSKALVIASRFVSARANLPILSNIVLKAEKTKLKILATDLEISISTSIGAKVIEDGEIAVPSRAITEIISNLFSKDVNLETDGEILKITAEGFKSSLNGANTSDYPKIPEGPGDAATGLQTKFFIPALNKVLFAVSSDESRPTLTGVLFINSEESLSLVATDGFRLSQKKLLKSESDFEKIIIPKRILGEVSKLFTSGDISFEVKASDHQVIFHLGETTLTSRIIEGDFPNFERIIPKSTITTVEVGKEELSRSLKLAAVFARDNANIVKLSLSETSFSIYAESSKNGMQEVKLDSKVTGEAMDISLNVRYMEEFLNVVSGESVTIKFNSATTPALFIDHKDPDFLHVIAPVRA